MTDRSMRRQNVRQGRKLIALPVMLAMCTGGVVYSRIAHSHDQRLIGTWMERNGRWATEEELRRTADFIYSSPGRTSTGHGQPNAWSLRADGSGNISKLPASDAGACRWYTKGDRLFILYGSKALTMREKLVEWWGILSGEEPKQWHAYPYLIDGLDRVNVDFGDPRHREGHWSVHLSRVVQTNAD